MVEITIPDPIEQKGTEVRLPSGARATIRVGTGRDARLAVLATGQPFDQTKFSYAVAAQVAKIDGKPLTVEAIDAMPIADSMALVAAVTEINFPTPPKPDDASA